MTKLDMREYVSKLEALVDKSLKKWKKIDHIENGEVVRLSWEFELSFMIVDVFWQDGDEGVNLQVTHPRHRHQFQWSGLTERTMDNLIDRVGNIAQTIMYRYPDAG